MPIVLSFYLFFLINLMPRLFAVLFNNAFLVVLKIPDFPHSPLPHLSRHPQNSNTAVKLCQKLTARSKILTEAQTKEKIRHLNVI